MNTLSYVKNALITCVLLILFIIIICCVVCGAPPHEKLHYKYDIGDIVRSSIPHSPSMLITERVYGTNHIPRYCCIWFDNNQVYRWEYFYEPELILQKQEERK